MNSIVNSQINVNTTPETQCSATGGGSNCQATPGVTTWVVNGKGLAGDPEGVIPCQHHHKTQDPLLHTCADTSWIVLGECQNEAGKFFAKRIYCGKEWCPVCGQQRSRAHNRRIARVLPKAMQIQTMGYFVIEFPDRYRKIITWVYSKIALIMASSKIVEVLAGKRMGRRGRVGGFFSRGLLRWHWFGDKVKGKWNPHANVLVDGAFIDNDKLEEIKAALRQALHCKDLIVHYSYCELPAQKFQRVEYITRATFRQYEWCPYMANQLWGFRNQRWWGSWKGEQVWSADPDQEADLLAADALEGGRCPDCGGQLVWTKPISAAWLVSWEAEEIGTTGYYRLPVKAFEGDQLTPADIMRLDNMKELRIVAVLASMREKLIPWQELLAYMEGEADDYDD
jgi:hypothetical protein